MKIVPAILAENYDDFLLRLKQAESFADYVQIDFMDGFFVPSKSFKADKINSIRTPLSFEIHLMVKHPSAFMSRISNLYLKKVIFHFESDVKHLDFINQMKKRGIAAGIAINPETQIGEFQDIAGHVNTLLFLTVDPGQYGSTFKPAVLKKIEEARQIFPDKIISVDGGVSLENLRLFFELGVDYVCVGSRIFLADNPEENYKLFKKRLTELEIKGINSGGTKLFRNEKP
jgi:ribulose-phosphate 3-epimerase